MRDLLNAIYSIGFVLGRLSKIIGENNLNDDLRSDFDKCLEHL